MHHCLQGWFDEFPALVCLLFIFADCPHHSLSIASLSLSPSISTTYIRSSFVLLLLSSSSPAQIPFVSHSASLFLLCPHFNLHSLSLLPLTSPSEGSLYGIIQPPRQLHITSCLRKLHALSLSPSLVFLRLSPFLLPCLVSLCLSGLIWIHRVWVQPDAARHWCQIVTQITSVWSVMEAI